MSRQNDNLVFRPFGQAEQDIDIDFLQPYRPCLVTQLLQCCSVNHTGQEALWDLTVSRRIEALLEIVFLGGTQTLTLSFPCSHPDCGEPLELQLSREEVLAMQPDEAENTTFGIEVDGTAYSFRRPTGSDQMRWLNAGFSDEQAAVTAMIQTLSVKPADQSKRLQDPEWRAALDEKMKTMDPLVHFNLTVRCPECDLENVTTIDLEGFLLRKLSKVQQYLLYEVHRLASYYHWSEGQILAVSPRRRAYYLSLIGSKEKHGKGGF